VRSVKARRHRQLHTVNGSSPANDGQSVTEVTHSCDGDHTLVIDSLHNKEVIFTAFDQVTGRGPARGLPPTGKGEPLIGVGAPAVRSML
jgi:hypothetical protein